MKKLVLKFGVYRGHSIRQLAKQFEPETVYGFDSFNGLTESWYIYKPGDMATDIPRNLPKNVDLVIGLIENSLPQFLESQNGSRIKFIHIDVDTYNTTKFILNTLKDNIDNDTIILFDEYWQWNGNNCHEKLALSEFLSENPNIKMTQINDRCFVSRSLKTFCVSDYLRLICRPRKALRLLWDRIKIPQGTSQAFKVVST